MMGQCFEQMVNSLCVEGRLSESWLCLRRKRGVGVVCMMYFC